MKGFLNLRLTHVLGIGLLGFLGSLPAHATLLFTVGYTANFGTNFGVNTGAAQTAINNAVLLLTNNFNDQQTGGTNVHINLVFDAVAGTGVFGQSSTFLSNFTWAAIRAKVVTDSHSADDATALAGSYSVADPSGGTGNWWVTTAQAKALGLAADNLSTDGTITFGTGNPFDFNRLDGITAGMYDFEGVVLHEVTEVMGRQGLKGGTIGVTPNSFSLLDALSYTGAGVRNLSGAGGSSFSINNGTTLIKTFNNWSANGLDSRDWAPGTNDAANQFSNPGVINDLSATDIRVMDVIGYDLAPVPEPGSIALLAAGLLGLGYARKRRAQKS